MSIKEEQELIHVDELNDSHITEKDYDDNIEDFSFDTSFVVLSPEINTAFEEYLKSQPTGLEIPTFTNRLSKLLWLQRQRNVGVYVSCDICNKLRFLNDTKDPLDLPKYWVCHMNLDCNANDCSKPEKMFTSQILAQMIDNVYNAGSIVWAKKLKQPWMPAIVCDDPDVEQFYWIENEDMSTEPTMYHVAFLDDPKNSAWCNLNQLKPFKDNPFKKIDRNHKSKSNLLEKTRKIALKAMKLPLLKRLRRFSFVSRNKRLYKNAKISKR